MESKGGNTNPLPIILGANSHKRNEQDRSFLGQIFVYLYYATQLDEEEVMKRAYNISYQTGELAKSTAMMLMQRGIEKGIEKELHATIKKMLRRKFKINEIAEILEIPLKLVKKVEKKLKEEEKKS